MDGGELGNSHRNFEVGSGDRLSAESLPLIDTRLLSQSELRALSYCSSLSPSSHSASLAASAGGDDDLTPKIDRSVFNESAGSRKQTFLRLRLARHPPQPRPPSPQRQRNDSSSEEKSQIASLLRSLFSVDSIQRKAEEDEGEEELGELEENEGQPLISVYQNPIPDSVQNVLVQGISGNETRGKRGRPSKIRNPSEKGINEETKVSDLTVTGEASLYKADSDREGPQSDKTCSNLGTESRYDASGIFMDSNSRKRKRGRISKSIDDLNQSAVNCKSEDTEELLNLENRECTMVDLATLAKNSEDPYEEELRRVTSGLETKEEFLGFLEQLDGEWVNTGKKKKVVKACDFGGYMPRGWKLMLCIKKKGSNMWLACRRYISPDGEQFATCKKVSMYLQSLLEYQSKNQFNSMESGNKTLGQPVMANESLVGNSDSMDLHVLSSETKQNLESRSTSSKVFEEAKGAENDDVAAHPVKISQMEKDDKSIPAADFLNIDNNHTKKRDDNMENLAALWNSEAQNEEKMMKSIQQELTTTTGELVEYFSSRNP